MTNIEHLTSPHNAMLLLADGTVFYGYGIGATGTISGEICFNTGLTGYQEVLSDPSYAGQVITFTFPHIGNVGANDEDIESLSLSDAGDTSYEDKIAARGLVIRENITLPSNFRSEDGLDEWLNERNVTGICGIDTRALTRHIRLNGAQNCTIVYAEREQKIPTADELRTELAQLPSLAGMELAGSVTCKSKYEWSQTKWSLEDGFGSDAKGGYHVVAVDFGAKLNILRSLASVGCKVTVVPAKTTAEDILELSPDGVFLSNGPGDPAATGEYAVPMIKELLAANMPIFGICLGHQMLSIALGAKTEKMHQGHRGANHPVKDNQTGIVEITSQNHGFVVSHGSLPADIEVTHISLFDGTIEGIRSRSKPAFSVQYHPESSPGPHDSAYLFERFMELIDESKSEAGSAAVG